MSQEKVLINLEKKVFISAIMINFNGQQWLPRALASLRAELGRLKNDSEIILVDNASTDGSVYFVAENFSAVRIFCLPQNSGYARAANAGARMSQGNFLLFLNNDIEILPGCLQPLINFLIYHPDYAVAAPAVFNPDSSFQLSFGLDLGLISEVFLKYFAEPWYAYIYRWRQQKMARDVDWVSGVAFICRRSHFFQVGGFDERYFLYVEDADLGRRLRRSGFRIRYLPEARIIHYRGAISSQFPRLALVEAKKSQLLYYSLHGRRLTFKLLKIYLLIQFEFKNLWARVLKDKSKSSIYQEVIRTIRSFLHAPSS